MGLAGSTPWTYDAQNRLVSAVTANGVTMTIAYDALNRPVMRSESTGSAPAFLVYDGWNLVDEYAGNAFQYNYLHGAQPDEMLTRTDSGGNAVYYLRDGLGSVRALTDASANVLELYNYDVYGQPTFSNAVGAALAGSANGNRFLFTGREYLSDIGVYDYRNRRLLPQFRQVLADGSYSTQPRSTRRSRGNQPLWVCDEQPSQSYRYLRSARATCS